MIRLGLAGHPVAHSLSPAIHGAALAAVGIEGRYDLFDVDEAGLARLLDELRQGALQGLNVTLPHKLAAFRLATERTERAQRLGAVNTLWATEAGGVQGDNTDLSGLVAALCAAWPERPWSGGRAVVVGAGGAARAAVAAAAEVGAKAIGVLHRSAEGAQLLARDLSSFGIPITPVSDASDAALVLQASSQGMGLARGSEAFEALTRSAEAALRRSAPGACVMDLVYRPEVTPWMAAAQNLGRPSTGGMEMLVRQAALAFWRWTGREPALAPLRHAARKALSQPPGSPSVPAP